MDDTWYGSLYSPKKNNIQMYFYVAQGLEKSSRRCIPSRLPLGYLSITLVAFRLPLGHPWVSLGRYLLPLIPFGSLSNTLVTSRLPFLRLGYPCSRLPLGYLSVSSRLLPFSTAINCVYFQQNSPVLLAFTLELLPIASRSTSDPSETLAAKAFRMETRSAALY